MTLWISSTARNRRLLRRRAKLTFKATIKAILIGVGLVTAGALLLTVMMLIPILL